MISYLRDKTISFVNSHKHKFINIFVYFLGLFLLKGASLILTPLYTNAFDTKMYGVIEYANTIYNLLSIVVGFGLSTYIGIEFFHVTKNERKIIVDNNIFMYLILSTVALSLVYLLYVLKIIFFNGIDNILMILILLNSFTIYFYNLFYIFCKNLQKTNFMTVVQFILGITSLLLNYLFIIILKFGIYSSMLVTLVINIIYIFLLIRLLRLDYNVFKVRINYSYFINVLRVSIPLLLASIVSWVLTLSDRFFLAKFCSLSDVGIYSLAYKISNIFNLLVINVLTLFYAPFIYKRFQLDGIVKTERKNRMYFYFYLFLSFALAIAFYLFVRVIFPFFVNNRYDESKRFILPLTISHIFIGATYFRTYLINYNKMTNYLLYINLISAVANFLANVIFIPKFGVFAAVMTTLLSTVVSYISSYVINYNVMKGYCNRL